ncbi:MAG TPA: ABC transporter permease [Blastocatellia bacterium]|nr:ABC transporter permease [Blastocatellia bacterium]
MDKVLVILKREYFVRVKTRAFVIGTVISPLLLLALALLPGLLAVKSSGQRNVAVLDASGDPQLFPAIQRRTEGKLEDASQSSTNESGRNDDGPRTRFVLVQRIPGPGETTDDLLRSYNAAAEKDPDQAVLYLGSDVLQSGEPVYYSKNTTDFSINSLRRIVSEAIGERKLDRAGFSPARISQFTKPVEMKVSKPTATGETREGGRYDFIIAFVLLFFIYMSVLFYGLFVMRGVIEEKHSRIVEVIVSSVKPTQMMLGKVVGIGLVGLTQIAIWAGTAVLFFAFGLSVLASRGIVLPSLPPVMLVYFISYFVLGYFLFATLYAMVGATVSSEEDAQQAQMPVTLLLVIPMMIFGMVIANPNSTSSILLSMVPFFAPTLMMMRIAVVNPPVWQILLSMLIMVLTILGCVWLAARIYRVGILMYGKRPSIAELGRWIRYS